MKLIKSTVMGTAVLALLAVACEDSEPSVHELVGTWKSTSRTTYYGASIAAADSTYANADYTNETLVFDADESGTSTDTFGYESYITDFTWSTSGTILSLTIEFGDATITIPATYDVTGTTLTLTSHEDADPDIDYPERRSVTMYTQQ